MESVSFFYDDKQVYFEEINYGILVEEIVKSLSYQENINDFFEEYKENNFGIFGEGSFFDEISNKGFYACKNVLSFENSVWKLNGESLIEKIIKDGFIENYGDEFYKKATDLISFHLDKEKETICHICIDDKEEIEEQMREKEDSEYLDELPLDEERRKKKNRR